MSPLLSGFRTSSRSPVNSGFRAVFFILAASVMAGLTWVQRDLRWIGFFFFGIAIALVYARVYRRYQSTTSRGKKMLIAGALFFLALTVAAYATFLVLGGVPVHLAVGFMLVLAIPFVLISILIRAYRRTDGAGSS
jgi:membrane protein implicated in regulation of membrane protease activity